MAIDFNNFDDEILDQATSWVARLRSDQVTDSDEAEFALWLSSSLKHRAAFDEIMVMWETMGTVASSIPMPSGSDADAINSSYLSKFALSEDLPASNDSSSPELSLLSSGSLTSSSEALNITASLNRKTTTGWLMAVAASVLVIGFIFLTKNPSSTTHSPENIVAQELFSTSSASKQRFTLNDGSTIELNAHSRVTVEYTEQQRNLTLLEGEVFFQVAHDPERPFVVTAANGVVTAVGTAFNINLDNHNVIVSVSEGLIKVNRLGELDTKREQASDSEIFVGAGNQILVNQSGINKQEKANLEQVLAWREKTLIFKDMELTVALTELNRYLKQSVDTSDASLDSLRISGTFSLEEPEATLKAIIASFELEAYKSPLTEKTRLYRDRKTL